MSEAMTAHQPTPAAWDDSRCDELEQLETLLREVGTINHGSDCLGRIARCIELAEALQRFDLDVDRPNFRRFLRGLAIAERNAALDRAEAAGVPTTVALPG